MVRSRASLVMLLFATLLLGGIVVFAVLRYMRPPVAASEGPAPTASAPADAPPATDTASLDVGKAITDSAARAAAWHADALLIGIEAFPVRSGKVDVASDGFVELSYGRPATSKLGPGAPLAAKRLFVRVDQAGTKATERTDAKPAKGLAEPNCPVEEVSRLATASGVPETTPLRMRYLTSDRHGRPVWRASSNNADHTRIVDAQSCAVLPR